MNTNLLFQLPPGVSGFYEENEATPAKADVYLFRRCCEQLAENTNYHLHNFYDFSESTTKSYHLAIFRHISDGFILVFCNRYYPLVAFSKVEDDTHIEKADLQLPKNEFIDDDLLKQYFKENFEVLNSDYLGITVDADNEEDAITVKQLTFYEFAEFSFWKPQVLADIIFNNWG